MTLQLSTLIKWKKKRIVGWDSMCGSTDEKEMAALVNVRASHVRPYQTRSGSISMIHPTWNYKSRCLKGNGWKQSVQKECFVSTNQQIRRRNLNLLFKISYIHFPICQRTILRIGRKFERNASIWSIISDKLHGELAAGLRYRNRGILLQHSAERNLELI